MTCKVCNGPLAFVSDKARGWHYFEQECISFLSAELAEWRSGKRRVYWRTDLDTGMGDMETHRAKVRYVWKKAGAKVRRVTVGPKVSP